MMATIASGRNLASAGRRDFNCVYLVKVLACVGVVGVHVALVMGYNDLLWFGWISRVGVLYFFVCTGYFAFKKIDIEHFHPRSTLAAAGKMARLYVLWTLVYLPHIIKAGIEDASEFGFLHGLLVECRDVVFNGFQHLWWLHAAMVAFLLLTLLLSFGLDITGILAIGGGLYVIGLFSESWYGLAAPLLQIELLATVVDLYNTVFISTQNGLFRGLLFVSIGMFFAKREFSMSFGKAVAYLCASGVLFTAEAWFVNAAGFALGTGVTLSIVPLVFFLFYVTACIDLKDRSLWRQLGDLSAWSYYVHWWIIVPFCGLFASAHLAMTGAVLPGAAAVVFSLVGTAGVSMLAMYLCTKPSLGWLKKFR